MDQGASPTKKISPDKYSPLQAAKGFSASSTGVAMQSQMKASLSEYLPRKIMQEALFNPRYKSIEKIGSGSFGEIHKVYDIQDKKLRAVKIEKKDRRGVQGMLNKEIFIMQSMKDCHHFPRLIDSDSNDQLSYVIMSYLGQNLEMLKKKYTQLSKYTTLLIGYQMIEALKLMHERGFLHRDIKPENFVIGTEGNHHNVYIIDFGLSKQYLDSSGAHIAEESNKGLVGTARYTSINSHKGIEQSRRDDMEALGYVLIYLSKGELPWQNLNLEKREEKFEMIKKLKIETKLAELCSGLPHSFQNYMEHVMSLQFKEQPNYEMLQEAFLRDAKAAAAALQFEEEKTQVDDNDATSQQHCFDWCEKVCSIQKANLEKLTNRRLMEEREKQARDDLQFTMDEMDAGEAEKLKRRETNFTQTEQFYSDTMEKGYKTNESFEVPLFKTEQSLSLSKQSIGLSTFGLLSQNVKGKLGLGNGNGNGTPGNNNNNNNIISSLISPQPSMILESANANFLEEHSQNSSEYNNVSCQYCPLQDEQAQVQKVISSNPTKLSRVETPFQSPPFKTLLGDKKPSDNK